MRFEVRMALVSLGERSQEFFIREALWEFDPAVKQNLVHALTGLDRRRATAILKDMLRLL